MSRPLDAADLKANRRRSIIMMRAAAGYDFRDAFGLIEVAVRRFADAKNGSRTSGLEDLLDALSARSPHRHGVPH